MLSIVDSVGLVLGGMLAGVVGSAGGITSLVSYPALLLVGLSPLHASIANNVALVACWPGSALASRPELRGWAPWLARCVPLAVLGGGLGAVLLLVSSPAAFARVVPFLVIAGSLGLLFEPRLLAWRQRGRSGDHRGALIAGLVVLSLYNGYFGAGSGVMILTLTLVLVEQQLAIANALKNMLVGAACVAAAALFTIVGPVTWSAVAPLAAGMLIGSNLGPRIARRVPTELLRMLIVTLGLVLAIYLWVDPHA